MPKSRGFRSMAFLPHPNEPDGWRIEVEGDGEHELLVWASNGLSIEKFADVDEMLEVAEEAREAGYLVEVK